MQITTYTKKKANKPKYERLIAAHTKQVRHDNTTYIVKVQTLGGMVLADAEPLTGNGALLNLFDGGNKTAVAIRALIEQGLYS